MLEFEKKIKIYKAFSFIKIFHSLFLISRTLLPINWTPSLESTSNQTWTSWIWLKQWVFPLFFLNIQFFNIQETRINFEVTDNSLWRTMANPNLQATNEVSIVILLINWFILMFRQLIKTLKQLMTPPQEQWNRVEERQRPIMK